MKSIILSIPIIIIFVFPAYSQQSIKAVRIEEPPSIDGHVNEPVWEKAYMVDEFYQRECRLAIEVSMDPYPRQGNYCCMELHFSATGRVILHAGKCSSVKVKIQHKILKL